jgi:hypothetical protein
LGEGHPDPAEIAGEDGEVGAVDRPVAVDVAGQDEEVEGSLGGERVAAGVGDRPGGQRGAVVAVGQDLPRGREREADRLRDRLVGRGRGGELLGGRLSPSPGRRRLGVEQAEDQPAGWRLAGAMPRLSRRATCCAPACGAN